MAFQNQPGCGCCGCNSGSVTATPQGCGNSLLSATWTIKLSGSTVASGTGGITAGGLAPGTYDIDIDNTGYNHYHTTFTINSSCTPVALGGLTLTLATGYICCSGMARQDTYYFTDGNGTHALAWNGTRWIACATHANYSTVTWSRDGDGICSVCTPVTIDVPYSIALFCSGFEANVKLTWMSTSTCDQTATIEANAICQLADPTIEAIGGDGVNCDFNYGTRGSVSTNKYNFDSASVQTMTFGTPEPAPSIVPGPYTMSR